MNGKELNGLGVYLFDVYRSPNIGVFLKVNETLLVAPMGIAESKLEKLSGYLGVDCATISIGGSRLLGPLMAINNKGVLVSGLAHDEEVTRIKEITKLPVSVMPSKFTAVGNLIVANDKGALASPLFDRRALSAITEVLDVPVEVCTISSYIQVGAMVVAGGSGGVVNPRASEEEIGLIEDVLKVPVEPATVNGGVPIVASGIVANSKGAVVGSVTRGPELAIISRALRV